MKVYMFYLFSVGLNPEEFKGISSDDIQNISDNETGKFNNIDIALYGYTPSKVSRDYFKNTRNMRLFLEKEVKMSKWEYEEFCEKHPEHLIEFHSFVTSSIVDGVYTPKNVLMLCPLIESDCVYYYYSEDYIMNIISNIMTEEYFELIRKRKFHPKIRRILDEFFLYDDMVMKLYPIEDLNHDSYTIDSLSIYVSLFSNTYKI